MIDNKRNTVQRQIVFDAVKELDIHATAEQVFGHVAKSHPSISKATVYRNLNRLADSGDLLNIGVHYGSTHYDHNCHEHYHFVCESCKRVFDIEGDFSDIVQRVRKTDGFEVSSCYVSFGGKCWECK